MFSFQGKLMSVKLSTSRLRTAPGMGDRSGCYRCGQEGHWSKECPLDQNGFHRNGSEPKSDGYDASGFGGRGRSRVYHPDFTGAPDYSGAYAPVHGFSRGAAHGGGSSGGAGMPGYGRGAGYESAMRYGPPGYGLSAVADHSVARMYGSDAAYRGNGSVYGAVPSYPVRRSPYEERDPYGVVDYYEKYRANAYGGGYFDERCTVPVPPPSATSSTAALMRDGPPPASRDPYECPIAAPPPPAAPVTSYFARDRSPIRRVPEAEGYTYDRSRVSPVSSIPRSSTYEVARDPAADRTRYTY